MSDDDYQAAHERLTEHYAVTCGVGPGAFYLLPPGSPAWARGPAHVLGEADFEAEFRRRNASGPDDALVYLAHS